MVAFVAIHAGLATTRVTASLYTLHEGYPEWWLGTLMSSFAISPIFLSLWAGRTSDAHGIRRPLAAAIAMGTVGAALATVSQHPAVLVVAALCTGGSLAVGAVAIQHEAGRMARDASDLKRVFSWIALGPALSNAGSPVLAGLLIDYVDFRAAFALATLLPLVGWLGLRKLAPHAAKPAPRPAEIGRSWALLEHKPLVHLIWVTVAISAAWDAHSYCVPLLSHARGLSASATGLVLGAFAAAATLVRLFITRAGAALDEQRSLRLAMAVASAASALYFFLPGLPGMVVGSAALGTALGSVQPMVLALLHQVVPPAQHGQAIGLRMLVTNASTVAIPAAFGLLAQAAHPAAPLWVMAAAVLLALGPASKLRIGGRVV
jgi:predicted MFS family arabinose efflux permease